MEHKDDLIAGRNPVMEALRTDIQVNRILVSRGKKEGTINAIIGMAKKKNILVKEVAQAKLDGILSVTAHQGVIAFISPIKYVDVDDLLDIAKERDEQPFLIVLDGIEDVHNLGAIARSAEAAGAHGIIIPKHRAAPVTPASVKASAGALLHIKVCMVTNIARTIDYLKKNNVWTVGTHQSADQQYYQANLEGPMAVVVGSEGKGISQLVLKKCDYVVNIPMNGKVTSLNASAAAAIVIYEVVKQRNK